MSPDPVAHFDAAAGERLHPAAREALLAALDQGWADPARLYRDARRARLLLDTARESVAQALGARPDEVSFPSSGTAAVHLALGGLAAAASRPLLMLPSAVEHSAVLQAAEHQQRAGRGRTQRVPVDATGRVDPVTYDRLVADADAATVVALQSANHEVGTVQPVDEVAESARRYGASVVVDAAQSLGRLPVPAGWSVLTASAHKWGGPAGVGVLAVRKGTAWRSPNPPDEREAGRVPGFVNIPAVAAAATALEAVTREAAAEGPRLRALVDRLRTEIPHRVPDVSVVGDPQRRLPQLVTFSLLYLDGEALVTALDRHGFAVGSGSSCTSSTLTPSHVLAAMGAQSHGNVRVSLGRGTTEAQVERFLDVLPGLVADLRAQAGVSGL